MVLVAGKAVVGLGLLVALALAARGPAPRRAPSGRDVRRLLVGVAALYAAAVVAFVGHRTMLAEAACAAGVAGAALAGWLSRGGDDGDGRDVPPEDGGSPVDWDRFDRERRAWERPPISSSGSRPRSPR